MHRFSTRELRLINAAATAMLSPPSLSGERAWHLRVLRRVTDLVGSDKSGIRLSADGDHRWTERGFDRTALPLYSAYFQRFDHGRALSDMRRYEGYVATSKQLYRKRLPEFRRSEFFCEFLQPFGFRDTVTLGTRRRDHEEGSTLYLWHEPELTEAGCARAVAILEILAPAFRAGMGAAVHLRRGNDAFFSVLDGLTEGCALFTPSGVSLHQNPALTAMSVQDAERERLQDAIREVLSSVRNTCSWGGGAGPGRRAVSTDERTTAGSYRIAGCALEASPAGSAAAILITVSFTPRSVPLAHPDGLGRRFGLTHRESEVARHLGLRRTNQEIASALGVSAHTARHHTESVMRKMETASRTEVAAKLARR